MLKAVGNEATQVYAQLLYEIAPSDRCVICHTELGQDFGHNKGVACVDTCHELTQRISALMHKIGKNVALEFHNLNLAVAEKRWKGMS